jgi:hypothetical protein
VSKQISSTKLLVGQVEDFSCREEEVKEEDSAMVALVKQKF